jgi:hypothetical protein
MGSPGGHISIFESSLAYALAVSGRQPQAVAILQDLQTCRPATTAPPDRFT